MVVKNFVFTLIAMIMHAQAYAVDYYVSASGGNDNNNGLTTSTAFQTLNKINTLNLLPGDSVLFQSGDVWEGMFWPKGSGTQALPIRIDSYGGNVNPIIDGDGYQASILIFNDDYYEIHNLELTNQASYLDSNSIAKTESGFGGVENDFGTGRNVRFGIKIVANTRSLTGFTFTHLNIHDIYPTPTNTNFTHQGYGIKFESQSNVGANAIYTISDVVMDSLNLSQTGHYAIWIRPLGLDGNDDHKHFNFTLRNSTFLNTGGSGFVAAKASNVLVENNTFDGSGSSIDTRMWKRGSGLWPFDSKDVVIQNNILMNAQGPLDSYGVHIDYNNENILVQYNYSYNNEGGFAQILGANINAGYRYNISVADGSRVEGVNGAIQNGRIFNVSNFCNINAGCPSTGNFIYNNTIYVPASINPEISFKAGSGETLLKNNIIEVEQGSNIINSILATQGVTYNVENNLFYPQQLFALAQPLTTSAFYVNPKLRMAGANGAELYKLLEDSPAISSGVIIGGSSDPIAYSQNNGGLDFFGMSVSNTNAPNIGAYNGSGNYIVPMINLPFAILLAMILITTKVLYNKRV